MNKHSAFLAFASCGILVVVTGIAPVNLCGKNILFKFSVITAVIKKIGKILCNQIPADAEVELHVEDKALIVLIELMYIFD